MPLEVRTRLREGLDLTVADSGAVTARFEMYSYSFDALSAGTVAALGIMAERFASDDELDDIVIEADGDFGVIGWKRSYTMFLRSGFLEQEHRSADRTVYRVVPDAFPMVSDAIDAYPSTILSLSRFAVAHVVDGVIELETPRSGWRVVCESPAVVALLALMASPCSMESLCDLAPTVGLQPDEASSFVGSMAAAGMVVVHDAEDAPSAEMAAALGQWSISDLLFHERSRVGRTQRPFGGTYPFKGTAIAPTPFVRVSSEGSIALDVPSDPSDVRASSFFDVLESRRSVREFDDEDPISRDELAELLWRTARVRRFYDDDSGGVADRPYPSGGAVHELDVYVAVRLVDGLDPGVYRYDPMDNLLVPVVADTPDLQMWMNAVPPWPQVDSRPQATLVISARFGRVMWKYQSMAYALILKNAGVLLQTLYLGVTALGLGGCALGAGDSERFSRLLGLDPYEESSVAEFAIGRPAARLTPSFTTEFAATTPRTDTPETSDD